MNTEEIMKLEEKYSFQSFTHQDAFDLAMILLRCYEKYAAGRELQEGLGIRICIHDLVVFQYLMDKKDEDIWLRKKENTVKLTGHSSYYAMQANQEDGSYEEIKENPDAVLAPGGFPLTVGGQLQGTISVSGLPGLEDQELLMEALEEFAG